MPCIDGDGIGLPLAVAMAMRATARWVFGHAMA
jgi:hypothetical protein